MLRCSSGWCTAAVNINTFFQTNGLEAFQYIRKFSDIKLERGSVGEACADSSMSLTVVKSTGNRGRNRWFATISMKYSPSSPYLS